MRAKIDQSVDIALSLYLSTPWSETSIDDELLKSPIPLRTHSRVC